MELESKKKILLIGIDGGTWTVLMPAIERGYMPFLQKLCRRGALGVLESTMPAITPAAWGAFLTGKNPGKTGVFDFAYWDKNRHENQFVSSLDLGTTFWDILSEFGKRVAVINVPLTYPPRPINGYLISGLIVPSLESEFTWPIELKKELLQVVPDYHIFDLKQSASYRSHEELLEQFVHQLIGITENHKKAALWILQKEVLDVFMLHFQATDVLQHVYWHFLDNTHPLFDSSKEKLIHNTFYRRIDQMIEQIYNVFVERNGQPLTIVLSDHGFQSHYKRFNLGNWLEARGYLKINPKAAVSGVPLLKKITRTFRIGKLLSLIFPQSTIGAVDKKYVSKSEIFSWDKSTAYSVGRSNEGFIYLLDDNEDQKRQCAENLCRQLMTIRDPQTGSAVVKKVWFKEELYHGDKMDRLPDLVLEPAEGWSFTGYYQHGAGLIHTVTSREDMHMGKHHSDGIFIIASSEMNAEMPKRIRIIDIAPLILQYLGCLIPETMDGQVPKQMFKDSCVADHTVGQKKTIQESEARTTDIYNTNEKQQIEQRLKDLGYL